MTALFPSHTATPPDHYRVIGHPVAHSQSPRIHALFAQACGQQMHYGRLLAPLAGFVATVQAFAAGQASDPDHPEVPTGPARGCNVTVPFKLQAFDLAPHRTERALLAQAANTLSFQGTDWLADNTDGAGLVRDIEHNAGLPLAGRRLLLLGAGGAAAGALGPLLACGPAELVLANRTFAKAEDLAQRHTTLAAHHGVQLRVAGLDAPGEAFDLVVNASASSLQGQALPLPDRVLAPGSLALDMMYGPPAAAFLRWAAEHGAQGRDGLGMLVEQAAEAFALWRGVRPDTAPVLAALRAPAA